MPTCHVAIRCRCLRVSLVCVRSGCQDPPYYQRASALVPLYMAENANPGPPVASASVHRAAPVFGCANREDRDRSIVANKRDPSSGSAQDLPILVSPMCTSA
eukprot:909017-Prorocentrum_minimum.AAC.1